MLLDLVEKLIDRCIQLVRESKERSRAFFEEFVTPAFDAFEAVHTAYVESFHAYRVALENAASFHDGHAEVNRLAHKQILYQSESRTRLLHLADSARDSWDVEAQTISILLQEFVNEIREYLVVNAFNHHDARNAPAYNNQRWSSAVLQSLGDIRLDKTLNDAEKRYRGLAHVDSAVAEMQFMYAQVTASFYTLKTRLIR